MRQTTTLTLTWFLFFLLETPAQAEIIYGVINGNFIISFDSATPGTLLTSQPMTGFVGNPSGDEGIGGGVDIGPPMESCTG